MRINLGLDDGMQLPLDNAPASLAFRSGLFSANVRYLLLFFVPGGLLFWKSCNALHIQ